MKTTNFGKLEVIAGDGGQMLLLAYNPALGHFELTMSVEELFLFLIEVGNAVGEGRISEKKQIQREELMREEQR